MRITEGNSFGALAGGGIGVCCLLVRRGSLFAGATFPASTYPARPILTAWAAVRLLTRYRCVLGSNAFNTESVGF